MLSSAIGTAQTILPAVIDRDTTLTVDGSPYYIQQSLSINNGITLKIKEGAQIILSGGVGINNYGSLHIEGTGDQMVSFTSDAPESRWTYISNQGSFIARYLQVRRAVRFVTSY